MTEIGVQVVILLHSFNDLKGFWDFYQKHPNPQTGMFIERFSILHGKINIINQVVVGLQIRRNDAQATWRHICMTLIANILTKKVEHMKLINGVSLTLRKHNSVIKVWQNNKNYSQIESYLVSDLQN